MPNSLVSHIHLFLLIFGWIFAVGASAEEKERIQLITGVSYEEGDFGTDINSKTVIVPFTVRYLGDRFDVGLTIPFVYQDSAEAVTIVDGRPERIQNDPLSSTLDQLAPGGGDLILKGRYYLLDDPGLDSFIPGIAPFAKIKFPTANENEGLGTGQFDYGFGFEFDKRIYDFFLFSDAGYTFIGEPPDRNLRDKISAGGGLGYQILQSLSAYAGLSWSRSLVRDEEDPLDLISGLTWNITERTSWSPFATYGLSNGSPDFGVGFAISYRFWRF